MLKFPKFLTALALAAALGPFAASARSERAPVESAAQQQFLTGTFGETQYAANFHGRAYEAYRPSGPFIVVGDAASEYAAANDVLVEN